MLEEEVKKDALLQKQNQELKEGKQLTWFALIGEWLVYKGRMVLSKSSKFIPTILQEYHYSPMGVIPGR